MYMGKEESTKILEKEGPIYIETTRSRRFTEPGMNKYLVGALAGFAVASVSWYFFGLYMGGIEKDKPVLLLEKKYDVPFQRLPAKVGQTSAPGTMTSIDLP